ncbi:MULTISPECIES: hypothetical protein [Actinoalloteichus]|uniref:hypothetical protein n=1 Tax=Actinoalloteichus TaxID=65496 RepID=UPI00095325E2|nr:MULTISPECIES: hypothetical protein [Actinoalloteichus]
MPTTGERYHQDTLPRFGLLLDRHVLLGCRPPPGVEATTVCGRVVAIRPGPFEVEPGVPAVGVRDCLECQDVLLGPPQEELSERSGAPLVLARLTSRSDVIGMARRVVHLCTPEVPEGSTLLARCGTRLPSAQAETVAPGEGMPCTACLLAGESPAVSADVAAEFGRTACG